MPKVDPQSLVWLQEYLLDVWFSFRHCPVCGEDTYNRSGGVSMPHEPTCPLGRIENIVHGTIFGDSDQNCFGKKFEEAAANAVPYLLAIQAQLALLHSRFPTCSACHQVTHEAECRLGRIEHIVQYELEKEGKCV
jgi:hypothetical protein